MADQKTLATDAEANAPAESATSKEESLEHHDRTRNLRMTVLLTVLGLLLFAVWYDYKVARPAVDQAFDSVGQLNRRINSSAHYPAMTNADVTQAIGFSPSYTITKGEYQVEVYEWTAGLPFRSHDYYAVYTGNVGNLKFMRHYKFILPVEDLSPKARLPHLASARQAARMPGPHPTEAVGAQWDAEQLDRIETEQQRQQERQDAEAVERSAIPARAAESAPDS